jgi:hypothetical protein
VLFSVVFNGVISTQMQAHQNTVRKDVLLTVVFEGVLQREWHSTYTRHRVVPLAFPSTFSPLLLMFPQFFSLS